MSNNLKDLQFTIGELNPKKQYVLVIKENLSQDTFNELTQAFKDNGIKNVIIVVGKVEMFELAKKVV